MVWSVLETNTLKLLDELEAGQAKHKHLDPLTVNGRIYNPYIVDVAFANLSKYKRINSLSFRGNVMCMRSVRPVLFIIPAHE